MRLSSRFIQFLLVGGFAAAVNFVSRFLLNEYLGFKWAVFVAYLIGMITAYVMTRFFVFEPSGKHPVNEMTWFVVVNLVALLQVWLISVALAEYFFPFIGVTLMREEMAHFIGLSVPAITSYFGHKYLTFAKHKDVL